MTTNDGVLAAAQGVLALALTEMRRCIEDASPDALNWRPGRKDTNSSAVLVVHSLSSTRSWLARAMGAPLPLRDRASEFATTATDPEALLAYFDEMSRECTALLDRQAPVDWGAIAGYVVGPEEDRRWVSELPDRAMYERAGGDAPREVAVVWALIHALEHLREHGGQMFLTRQLWNERTPE